MTDSNKIGYIRSSKKEHPKHAEAQSLALYERGVEKLFVDADVSGYTSADERPGFVRMANYLVKHPEVKEVWVTDWSRIGKSTSVVEQAYKLLVDRGADVRHIYDLRPPQIPLKMG